MSLGYFRDGILLIFFLFLFTIISYINWNIHNKRQWPQRMQWMNIYSVNTIRRNPGFFCCCCCRCWWWWCVCICPTKQISSACSSFLEILQFFFWFPSVSSWSSFFPKYFYCFTFISVIRYFHSGFSVSYEMKNEWNIINNDSKRVQNPGCLYFSIFLLLHYIYANWIWKKFLIQFTCQSITGKKITNEKIEEIFEES